MGMPDRPQEITFTDMRDMGLRGLLIHCSDYRRSESVVTNGQKMRGYPISSRSLSARPAHARLRHAGFGRASSVDPKSW
jgi:hypothetical protein